MVFMSEILAKEYIDSLVLKIVDKLNTYPETSGLISVVLTGSLGRNEPTYHILENGELFLDSDVELALVFKDGQKSCAEAVKTKLIDDFSEDMNPMTISESRVKNAYNFNYTLRKPKYASIFMYDFFNGSRTIWGEELLDKNIVVYDKYEAKRIVANRIGELVYLESVSNDDNKDKIVKQWECKLLLAMGSALCILDSKYVSQYFEQKNYILSQESRIKEFMGNKFIEDYTNAYMYLRKGASEFDITRSQLKEYVKKMNRIFSTCNISSPKINSFSRKLKYTIACVKSKSPFNPFTCEEDIIDSLIKLFTIESDEIFKIAQAWKKVLY